MDKRIVKTKAAIQNAYLSLLMEKNTTKISIAEIARHANIDRKTFYLHYRSVDDIISEFTEALIGELLQTLEQNNFFQHPYDVGCIFRTLNHILGEHMDFYRHIARHTNYNFFWEQVQEIIVRTVVDTYSHLANIPKEQLELYTQFFASGIIAVYQSWLKGETNCSLDELGNIPVEIAYHGIQNIFSLPPKEE